MTTRILIGAALAALMIPAQADALSLSDPLIVDGTVQIDGVGDIFYDSVLNNLTNDLTPITITGTTGLGTAIDTVDDTMDIFANVNPDGTVPAPGLGFGIIDFDDFFNPHLNGSLLDAEFGVSLDAVPGETGIQLLFETESLFSALAADFGDFFLVSIYEFADSATITRPDGLPTPPATPGTDFNTAVYQINPVTNVPLPAGLPLLLTGLGAIVVLRRRRAAA